MVLLQAAEVALATVNCELMQSSHLHVLTISIGEWNRRLCESVLKNLIERKTGDRFVFVAHQRDILDDFL
jgi:hypothetical protein